MPFRRGPHQRRLVLRRLLRVHVGAASNQHPDGVRAAAARARHDRRLAGGDRRIGIGAGLQEQLDERRAAVGAGQRQRGDAEVVRRVRIGAGADQQVGRRDIVPMRGPQERRRAIIRSDIHVGVLVQQRADLLLVLVPGRLDQPEIAGLPLRRPRPSAASSRTRRPHRSCCIRRACRSLCGSCPHRLPPKLRPAEFIACGGQNSYDERRSPRGGQTPELTLGTLDRLTPADTNRRAAVRRRLAP